MDTDLCVLFSNPAMERYCPPLSRPLIGKKCHEVYHGRNQACDLCPCLETLQSGEKAEAVIPHLDPEGRIKGWYHHFSFPLKDPHTGNLTGVIEHIRDISGQRQTEETLRSTQNRFQTIMDNLADGYYEVDLKGNLTFFNDSLATIFGYPREELLGMNNREYTDKENAPKMYQAFNLVYRTGTPIRGVRFETVTKQKNRRQLELSISLRRDEEGNPVGFQGIARDITDLIDFQKSLKAGEERYRTIIETIEDGYYEVDLKGNLTFYNDAYCRITGYHRDELMGMSNR